MNEFRADVATALAVSVLLWRDAMPASQSLPGMDEMARIELGRILTHRNVLHDVPGLRAIIGPALLGRLHAEPWNIEDPVALLEEYMHRAHDHLPAVGRELMRSGHQDVAYDMVRRRGSTSKISSDDRVLVTAQDAARVLQVPTDLHSAVGAQTRALYRSVHFQLA